MLVFSKKNKKSKDPITVETNNEVTENRDDALSLWFDNINAAKAVSAKAETTDISLKSRTKEGYVFCRKCYKIHSAKELICSSCGTSGNNKK